MSSRAASVAVGFGALLLLASCRSPVAPSEPGSQPADGGAAAVRWTPPPDPTRTSAFEGQTLAPAHAHHGHGGHGGHGAPAGKPATAPDAKAPARTADEPKPFTSEPPPDDEEPTR